MSKSKKSIFCFLFKLIIKDKKSFLNSAVFLLIKNAFNVISLFWFYQTINILLIVNKEIQEIILMIFLTILFFALNIFVEKFWQISINKNIYFFRESLQRFFINDFKEFYYEKYYKNSKVENIYLFNEIPNNISIFFCHVFHLFLDSLIKIISLFVLVFILNWSVGIIVLFLALIIYFVFKKIFQKNISLTEQKIIIKQKFNQKLLSSLNSFKAFYFLDKTNTWIQKNKELFLTNKISTQKLDTKQNLIIWVYVFGIVIFEMIPFAILIVYFLNDFFNVDIGILITIPIIVKSIFFEIVEIYRSEPSFKFAIDNFKSINILNKNEYKDEKIIKEFEILEIENLQFKHLKNLKKINQKIYKNQKILIVGKSGIGKSTIVKSLLSINQDYEGKILFNNQKLSVNQNIKIINFIDNNSFIFNSSLKNNLTLFNEKITNEKITKSLELVELKDKLHNLEDGVNEMSLSEGEKQKIALARFFLNRKDFLILDEAFSSIDKKSTNLIRKKLLTDKDLTLIEISHNVDPSEYSKYDEVIDLDATTLRK
ncbi:ABC transporter ATP-binding protein [Mycoplasmopsis pulmonis]|uniref:ABC transporter ATP-binding protein n=1 Tax=Mycoplasmopsis pulmonis TaxID=2107 RepID=UPI002ACE46F9|nr:ABC transporter ATP-binding protein [Mycoplasmopsis pulmonis]MDZ7293408.1 ABC transporter ATP-binding protein/permease [Mycoplasmopsis pulmonis]